MGSERDPVVAASEARALCAIVTKVARRDLEGRLRSGGAGIRAMEHGVLRHLAGGERTLAYLSREMMASPSTLVSVVDGLEGKGLVERGRDPQDRRLSPLSLTAEGEELLVRTPAEDAGSALVSALARMEEKGRAELLASLRELVGHLAEDGDPVVASRGPKDVVQEASRGLR